jgi:hypothetical protein
MNVWTKVLLGLLFVAAIGFFHAAIRTVKTFQYWSGESSSFERQLTTVRAEIASLRNADHARPMDDKTFGVQQLRFDLGRLLANRGRIWSNCTRKNNVALDSRGRTEVTVSCDDSSVTSDKRFDKLLLYAFEDGDDPSSVKYLSEFTVKAVGQNGIVLVSTTQLTPLERKHIQESRTPWVLYELMPTDQHDLFASSPDDWRKMPDDLRKKFFPDPDPGMSKADQEKWKETKWWLPEEYALDGQEIQGKKFERELRDYLQVIRDCETERTLFDDRIASLERDENYLKAAKDDSEKQLAFVQRDRAQAIADRDREIKQRDATAAHYATLQHMLDANGAAVAQALYNNAEAARRIAEIQKDAADQIDRRSHSMARYGTGAN